MRRHPPSHHTYFEAVVESGDAIAWIRPTGDLTIASAERFEAAADVPLGRGRHVVVDLSGLQFLDSTGLSALLTLSRHVRAHGSGFSLEGAHGPVQLVLELVGMGQAVGDR